MLNTIYSGCQIDLDKGEGNVYAGTIKDSIYYYCTNLWIKFRSEKKLNFSDTYETYFRYRYLDWIPISFTEIQEPSGLYNYDMMCYPKEAFIWIDSAITSTMALATKMKMLLTDESVNLMIDCPVINLYSGELIRELRLQSMMKAYAERNMKQAWFMYFTSRGLVTCHWQKILSGLAASLACPEMMQGQNTTVFSDDVISREFDCARPSHPWGTIDYLNKMIGREFTIAGTQGAYFAKMYTIKFADNDQYDASKPFLCTGVEWNIMEQAGWKATFSEINCEEGPLAV